MSLTTQEINERYYERNNLTQFNTRISQHLKDDFERACKRNDRTSRSVLIELLEAYVAEND